MGIVTDAAVAPEAVGANGLAQMETGQAIEADALNALFKDLQAAAAYGLLSGVLLGGVCTVTSLTVKVPSGTRYFARQVWAFDADAYYPVTDDAVNYLWGCSDGIVRITNSTTAPTGFTNRTACILTKATAVSGVVALDNTAQWKARQTDETNRTVTEAGGVVIDYTKKSLDLSNSTLIVPVLASDPSSPVTGQIWINSTSNTLKARIGGTTKSASLS